MKKRFAPVDLGDWMALAEAAGVAAMPSRVVADVTVESITRFDEEGGHQAEIGLFYRAVRTAVEEDLGAGGKPFLRWSCCSTDEVKYRIGSLGDRSWVEHYGMLPIDDMRSFGLIMEYPKDRVEAHLRPWMNMRTRRMPPLRPGSGDREYSLEVRVFVWDGEIRGVSNYYPQLAVAEDDADMLRLAKEARVSTEALMAEFARSGMTMMMPQLPDVDGSRRACFTADFGMTDDGRVLMIEGGPPHSPRWGAHPCCFGEDEIAGVRLNASPTTARGR